jgi:ketosteroid isomerase-like protein
MLTREFAERFAQHWLAAWNAHDLEEILSHYTQDFEMVSPYIVQIAAQASGKLQGKAAVGAYWRMALEKMPDLHFELINVMVGVDSVTINYHGARGLAAEVFYFDAAGLVVRACAHYA